MSYRNLSFTTLSCEFLSLCDAQALPNWCEASQCMSVVIPSSKLGWKMLMTFVHPYFLSRGMNVVFSALWAKRACTFLCSFFLSTNQPNSLPINWFREFFFHKLKQQSYSISELLFYSAANGKHPRVHGPLVLRLQYHVLDTILLAFFSAVHVVIRCPERLRLLRCWSNGHFADNED